jgi:hypothetical protein
MHMPELVQVWFAAQSAPPQHWRQLAPPPLPHRRLPASQHRFGSDWHLPALGVPLGHAVVPLLHSHALLVELQIRFASLALQSPSPQQPLLVTHLLMVAQNLGVPPPQQPSVAGSVHLLCAAHHVLGAVQHPSRFAAHLTGMIPGQVTVQPHRFAVHFRVPSVEQFESSQQSRHAPLQKNLPAGQQPAALGAHWPLPQWN